MPGLGRGRCSTVFPVAAVAGGCSSRHRVPEASQACRGDSRPSKIESRCHLQGHGSNQRPQTADEPWASRAGPEHPMATHDRLPGPSKITVTGRVTEVIRDP